MARGQVLTMTACLNSGQSKKLHIRKGLIKKIGNPYELPIFFIRPRLIVFGFDFEVSLRMFANGANSRCFFADV